MFTVKVRFAASSPFGPCEQVFRNVTEIHYNWPRIGSGKASQSVAFESDEDGTGSTYLLAYIEEFEATERGGREPMTQQYAQM